MLIISAVALLLSATANAQSKKLSIQTCEIQYASHEYVEDIHDRTWIVDGDPVPYKTNFIITKDHFIHVEGKERHHKYDIDVFSEFEIKKGVDMKFTMVAEDGNWYNVEFHALDNELIFYYSGGRVSRFTKFTIDRLTYK